MPQTTVDASSYCPIADCLDGTYCCATDVESAVSGACCSQQNSKLFLFPATVGTTVTVIGVGGFSNQPSTLHETKTISPAATTVVITGSDGSLTTAVTTPPSSNSVSPSADSSGSKNTLAIALGAGIGGGALALFLVAFAIYMFKKKKVSGVPGGGGTTEYKGPIIQTGGQPGVAAYGPGQFVYQAAPPAVELAAYGRMGGVQGELQG